MMMLQGAKLYVWWIIVVVVGMSAMLTRPIIARGAVVYVALGDGVWRTYFQASLEGTPEILRSDVLTEDSSGPAVSADGRNVALEVRGSVMVCSVKSTSECRRVQSRRGTLLRPSWHPVTEELVVAEYVADGKNEGANILSTRNSLSELAPLLAQPGVQDDPAFSGDGRLLAYTVGQTVAVHRAGVQVVQQIWLADMVTGRPRQLLAGNSRDLHPNWAPSGRAIAFASDRSGDFEIWTVEVDGTGLRQVTSGAGSKTRPRWSPDGKSIMFTMAREGRLSLWIIDADGSNLRQFEPFGPNADVQLRDADWR